MKQKARRIGSGVLSLLIAATGLLTAFGSADAAQAATPEIPAAEAFQAPQCVGETEYDPANIEGIIDDLEQGEDIIPDLTQVFGQRLTDYNAGKMVILYDSTGTNSIYVPVCGTRHVPGAGAVSEWMYCTDLFHNQCSITDAEGRLTQDGTVIEGLADLESNPRLDEDQERLIRYLLTNEVMVYENRQPIVISDANYDTRRAKQRSIWCISEEDLQDQPSLAQFCADNFSETRRQELLASLPADPVFEPRLFAGSNEAGVQIGDTVEVAVSTNFYEAPISVEAQGAELAICPESSSRASIVAGQVVVNEFDSDTITINLCLSWQSPGIHSILFEATPEATTTQSLSWVQSPTLVEGKPCQVYAGFDAVAGRTLTAQLAVDVAEPEETVDPVEPVEPEIPVEPAANDASKNSAGVREGTLAVTGGSSFLAVGALAALLVFSGLAVRLAQRAR